MHAFVLDHFGLAQAPNVGLQSFRVFGSVHSSSAGRVYALSSRDVCRPVYTKYKPAPLRAISDMIWPCWLRNMHKHRSTMHAWARAVLIVLNRLCGRARGMMFEMSFILSALGPNVEKNQRSIRLGRFKASPMG